MVSKKTLSEVRRRMQWAAIGAAIGAGAGAISNPRWAGTGGAIGGTAGALAANTVSRVQARVGESRGNVVEVAEEQRGAVESAVQRLQ